MEYQIPKLPLSVDLETKDILKQLARSHQALAELKGVTGITEKLKLGRENYYINTRLFALLSNVSEL